MPPRRRPRRAPAEGRSLGSSSAALRNERNAPSSSPTDQALRPSIVSAIAARRGSVFGSMSLLGEGDELDDAFRHSAQVRGVGRLQQQFHPVDARVARVVAELLVGRHRPLVERVCLRHRRHRGHRVGRRDRRVEGLGPFACLPPMTGKLDRGVAGSGRGELRLRDQRDREAPVQIGALGREQRFVDRFALQTHGESGNGNGLRPRAPWPRSPPRAQARARRRRAATRPSADGGRSRYLRSLRARRRGGRPADIRSTRTMMTLRKHRRQ